MSPEDVRSWLRILLPEPHASLAAGLLLGLDLEKNTPLYEALLSAGLIHIVVLSGTNVSLLHNTVAALLPYGNRRVRTVLALGITGAFCLWVGPEPPIYRAVMSALLTGVGSLAGRPVSGAFTLALTAVISLIIHPEWVSSLSFALTYAASTALVLSGKPRMPTDREREIVPSIFLYLVSELRTSFFATLGTAPLVWFFFGRIQMHSIISTAAISWTIVPVTVLGFVTIIAYYFSPTLGMLSTYPLQIVLDYIITIGFTFA